MEKENEDLSQELAGTGTENENNELLSKFEEAEEEEEVDEYDEEDDDEEEVEDSDAGSDDKIAIDLSDNAVYRGLCTLLEDESGNNLLEYISLLHSELIGHNKTMKLIKKDLGRLANAAEQHLKNSNK